VLKSKPKEIVKSVTLIIDSTLSKIISLGHFRA
jgi:hypothetical protein